LVISVIPAPGSRRARRLDQLQIVDDDQPDILLALQPPGARRDLGDGDAAGVVDIERQGGEILHGQDELLPLALGELAVADLPHLDLGLLGQDTRRELLRRHFEREEQHRRAARHIRRQLPYPAE
jgi:hypothetical protein